LLAVIRSLHHWSHLLRGTVLPVIIWTDHKNLTYWAEPHKVGPRAATWQVELTQYNFELHHKSGESNKADLLSHRPDYDTGNPSNDHLIVLPLSRFANMSLDLLATFTPDPVELALADTEDLEPSLDQQVIDAQEENFPELRVLQPAYGLTIDSQNCFRKDQALVVVGNDSLRRGVIHTFHDLHTAGHPGISNTLALLRPYYWWPHMKDFITSYIKGCATCQANKINTHPMKPPLFPITPTSTLPFQTVTMDFITKLPSSNDYDTILTITDHDVSKACILIPYKETIDSAGVAALYANHVFPHYGIPLKVISNRDPRLDSTFTMHLCRLLGIKQNISTVYHPQTDGQSEHTNQSLEMYLRLYCDSQQHEWSKLLPLA